jgi:predicted RNase H-like HicB family nuclease
MATYDLYLESGPKHRTTMAHVLSDKMLGCNFNGPTTEQVIEDAADGIRLFLRFLKKHGEKVDPEGEVKVRVVEHVDRGDSWLGRGSPYHAFAPDLEAVSARDCEIFAERLHWMREDLAEWLGKQTAGDLTAEPKPKGRPAMAIALHILQIPGAYLSPALDGTKGYSRIVTLVERGELPITDGLLEVAHKAAADLARATPEQRSRVLERLSGERRTLRKSIRRMLEHDWEHLSELARRPGGPQF